MAELTREQIYLERATRTVWMAKVGKKAAGRLLDGVEHNARLVIR